MTPLDTFLDVARVYRAYGEDCARAQLIFHGATVDQPEVLEAMLAKVRAYVQRTSFPIQHARQDVQEQAA